MTQLQFKEPGQCAINSCDYDAEVFGVKGWHNGFWFGDTAEGLCRPHAPSQPRSRGLIEPLDHNYDIAWYDRVITPIGVIDVPVYIYSGDVSFAQEDA